MRAVHVMTGQKLPLARPAAAIKIPRLGPRAAVGSAILKWHSATPCVAWRPSRPYMSLIYIRTALILLIVAMLVLASSKVDCT